jgi:hypothetical protein
VCEGNLCTLSFLVHSFSYSLPGAQLYTLASNLQLIRGEFLKRKKEREQKERGREGGAPAPVAVGAPKRSVVASTGVVVVGLFNDMVS